MKSIKFLLFLFLFVSDLRCIGQTQEKL